MKHYPTYLQTLGLILIVALFGVMAALLVFPFADSDNLLALTVVYSVSLMGGIASALFIRKDFSFPTAPVDWRVVALGCLAALSFHFLSDPFVSLFPIPDSLKEMTSSMYRNPVVSLFLIVLLAPLLEELLFRGVVLHGFLKNYKPSHAIASSALVFAIIHGNLAQGLGAFFIGVVIGWIYWKTNSIIPGIIIHFVNNAVAFSSIFFFDEKDVMKNMSEYFAEPWMYWAVVVAGGTISAICLLILHQKFLNHTSQAGYESVDSSIQQ
ncbi:MAG: lysostaphin resistance A-like protein [Flammeovirgaceae bacterium]